MSFAELLITCFYILVFFIIVRIRSKRLATDSLKAFYIKAFWLKMLGSILFMLYYTYLTGGDTRTLYFAEGERFYRLIVEDTSNFRYFFLPGSEFDVSRLANPYNAGYFLHDANFMVIRLTAFFCFFTLGYYTPVGLFFAMFAFSGIWRLFLFFYSQRPALEKVFAYSILFFPSIIFWSSGILKDSLCIGSLGWLTYSFSQILRGKYFVVNIIKFGISVYLLASIKIYILLAYAPLFLFYLVFEKVDMIKISLVKYVSAILLLAGIAIVFGNIYDGDQEELSGYSIDNLAASIAQSNEIFASMAGRSDAESTFNLGAEYDGTGWGLVKVAPYAIAATFYRPFIWETRKLSQLMAAVESLILAFFTLKILLRVGPFQFIRYIFSDPLALFCISFAVIFGLFVGTSTLNFGTLVRYKIPCMPYYAIGIFLVYHRAKSVRMEKATAIQSSPVPPAFA